jgi:hypothetical protein
MHSGHGWRAQPRTEAIEVVLKPTQPSLVQDAHS